MIGERENFQQETDYGTLVMRPFNIDGNDIKAFYDAQDDLVFVLDNTLNDSKPNVLLVINPDGDKKWDEILSGEYGVDLESVRPKQDNKYQKLDIEYSGLGVYEELINAYNAGESLDEYLNQLAILRDSAARHSAMLRLNAANEIIAKTNATIIKTKESIIRLQERLKTLRAKLGTAKKEIGKVPTKQSASKVLKIESQIEATNEKLKRAKNRLDSAQRRLEMATVDAELASNLLNQPGTELKPSAKTVRVAPVPKTKLVEVEKPKLIEAAEEDDSENDKENNMDDGQLYDVDTKDEALGKAVDDASVNVDEDFKQQDVDDEEVKPLFNEDPNIMDEDIAFQPIDFETKNSLPQKQTEQDIVVREDDVPSYEPNTEIEENITEKPVLESMTPIDESARNMMIPESFEEEVVEEKEEPVADAATPVIDMMKPVAQETFQEYSQPEIDEEAEAKTWVDDAANEVSEEVEKQESVAEKVRQPAPVVMETERPLSPQINNVPAAAMSYNAYEEAAPRKNKFLYYFLLFLLILLSVFTLWLYQNNMKTTTPDLVAETTETKTDTSSILKPKLKAKKSIKKQEKTEEYTGPVFLDKQENVAVEPVETKEEMIEPQEESVEQPQETVPFVEDAVPAHLKTSGMATDTESDRISEDEILANKPVYEPGGKETQMLVSEDFQPEEYEVIHEGVENINPEPQQDQYQQPNFDNDDWIIDPDSLELDEEEAAYQAEQAGIEYEE